MEQAALAETIAVDSDLSSEGGQSYMIISDAGVLIAEAYDSAGRLLAYRWWSVASNIGLSAEARTLSFTSFLEAHTCAELLRQVTLPSDFERYIERHIAAAERERQDCDE